MDSEKEKQPEEQLNDRLEKKPLPSNHPVNNLQTLQERLEAFKQDPHSTPWESAFEQLIGKKNDGLNNC